MTMRPPKHVPKRIKRNPSSSNSQCSTDEIVRLETPDLIMKLPPELRNLIYKLVLTPDVHVIEPYKRSRKERARSGHTLTPKKLAINPIMLEPRRGKRSNWRGDHVLPGLLATSHEIRREALPMFYASNFIVLHISTDGFDKVLAWTENFVNTFRHFGVLDCVWRLRFTLMIDEIGWTEQAPCSSGAIEAMEKFVSLCNKHQLGFRTAALEDFALHAKYLVSWKSRSLEKQLRFRIRYRQMELRPSRFYKPRNLDETRAEQREACRSGPYQSFRGSGLPFEDVMSLC